MHNHSLLSERERAILDVIKNNLRSKGYPPSVREIGERVGLSSSSTVHGYLKKLEEKGLLRRDPTKPRALELILDQENMSHQQLTHVPVLGNVAAGQPILAVENHGETFPLPETFTGNGEFFLLNVKGDSMIEAGIFEGDMLLVRRQPNAENGDIVVVLLEDEATVKRLYRKNDHLVLKPENSTMSPIIAYDAKILGKVTGLIRKY